MGKNTSQIREIIAETCSARQAKLLYAPDLFSCKATSIREDGQHITFPVETSRASIFLPLLGNHQAENFQNVLGALTALGLRLEVTSIQRGLDQMKWWGRMQVVQKSPRVIYDVAHNPEGLERLQESLTLSGHADAVLIAAFNIRKNVKQMLTLMSGWSGPILYTLFHGHSAVSESGLIQSGVESKLIETSPEHAYDRAVSMLSRKGQTICFFGSHYLAEEIYPLFGIDGP